MLAHFTDEHTESTETAGSILKDTALECQSWPLNLIVELTLKSEARLILFAKNLVPKELFSNKKVKLISI